MKIKGVKCVSKISQMLKTKDYKEFDVKTDAFETIGFLINKDPNGSNQFVVKY